MREKRDLICEDYGSFLEECGGLKATSKKEELVEEERPQRDESESYDYELGGSIGENNISLFFVGRRFGIGITDLFVKNTSSAGHKYEFQNRSLDFTYSFLIGKNTQTSPLTNFTFGMGVIVDGDAKSSTQNLKSDEVDGYRIMGLIGTNLGRWEVHGGYQYSSFENKKFTTTKNLPISGGLMVFGVGVGL